MNKKTLNIVYAGLFLALSIILPYILHFAGSSLGSVFLPMHIPVLLAGFICGPLYGAIVGILAPLLNHSLNNMPPIPILWFMIFELFVYGLVAGILYEKLKLNYIISLVGSMIAGRVMYAFSILFVTNILNITLPPYINAAIATTKGVPGIIIQLVLIPSILWAYERSNRNVKDIIRS